MKILAVTLALFTLFACSESNTKEELSKLKVELENTKAELTSCAKELTDLKNTAENRLIRAKKLLSDNDLIGAKKEFSGIVENFKGTNDATNASREIEKIDRLIEQKRAEAERKKALGYKILKPTSRVNYGDIALRFDKIWKGKRWTFDDYGYKYFLRDAQRGNSHIMVRVSITSAHNNPVLPPILVYKMESGELKLLKTLKYKFRRWKDYGSYLGNYADYGNDFAHSKTIPFNCGVELSNDDLKSGTIYIILKKQGCFNRTKTDYGNPEIAYRENSCHAKEVLRISDFDHDYVLLKKI